MFGSRCTAEHPLYFEHRICERWYRRALEELQVTVNLSRERLQILAHDFWTTNSHKSTMPRSTFVDKLRMALEAPRLGSPIFSVPNDLLPILIHHFSLTAEIQTNVFLHSPQFLEWCSDVKEDTVWIFW